MSLYVCVDWLKTRCQSDVSPTRCAWQKKKKKKQRRRCKAVNQRVARGQPFFLVSGQPSFFFGLSQSQREITDRVKRRGTRCPPCRDVSPARLCDTRPAAPGTHGWYQPTPAGSKHILNTFRTQFSLLKVDRRRTRHISTAMTVEQGGRGTALCGKRSREEMKGGGGGGVLGAGKKSRWVGQGTVWEEKQGRDGGGGRCVGGGGEEVKVGGVGGALCGNKSREEMKGGGGGGNLRWEVWVGHCVGIKTGKRWGGGGEGSKEVKVEWRWGMSGGRKEGVKVVGNMLDRGEMEGIKVVGSMQEEEGSVKGGGGVCQEGGGGQSGKGTCREEAETVKGAIYRMGGGGGANGRGGGALEKKEYMKHWGIVRVGWEGLGGTKWAGWLAVQEERQEKGKGEGGEKKGGTRSEGWRCCMGREAGKGGGGGGE